MISRSNQTLFAAWDQEDPVDDWERERARRIAAIQGNSNPFIWGKVPSATPRTSDVTASPRGAIIGHRTGKRYDRPDCPGYARPAPQHSIRFTSEAAAHAAGDQLAGNCP